MGLNFEQRMAIEMIDEIKKEKDWNNIQVAEYLQVSTRCIQYWKSGERNMNPFALGWVKGKWEKACK